MKPIILATDRKKRKKQKKIVLFIVLFISLLVSIFLVLKDQSGVTSDSPTKVSYEITTDNSVDTSHTDSLTDDSIDDDSSNDAMTEKLNADPAKSVHINDQFSYIVNDGDTLESIFEQLTLNTELALGLVKSYPELAQLKKGQTLFWVTDQDGRIEYMDWVLSNREEQVFKYSDTAESHFSREVIVKKGIWKSCILKGSIKNSLGETLQKLGLGLRQINQIVEGLKPQLSLRKLRNGDKIKFLANCEYLDNKIEDVADVKGFHLVRGKEDYYAILADNGHFYSERGAVKNKSQFARYPLLFTPRVSSKFNPYRRHPITHRVRPHKGTDFSIKSGTVIIAPADGVVSRVAYQRNGAGKYIKIAHDQKYSTVYMHLSRFLVKQGQRVKKGQRIAYSGNTGRSTGAHLHYEFHINGHAVNPMTVRLPGVASHSVMSNKERKVFLAKAKKIVEQLK